MKKNLILVLSLLMLTVAAMSVPKIRAASEQTASEPLMPGVPADAYSTLEAAEAPVKKYPADIATILTPLWHYQGAYTSKLMRGIAGVLYVTNPSVPYPNRNDFYASRLLMQGPAGTWIEIGWAETGWTDWRRGYTYNQQWIYVYDSTHNTWEWDTTHRISSGQSIEVQIRWSSGNNWEALLRWSGQWVSLHIVDISFSVATKTEEYGEIYVPAGDHWFVPNTNFASVRVLVSGELTYRLWDTSITPTIPSQTQYPYTVTWLAQYNKWYVQTLP